MMLLARSTFLAIFWSFCAAAQDCGNSGQRPCDGADCLSGAVFYKPEAEFCCDQDETWSCDSGLTCQIIPNPFDNNSTGAPLGLSRLCLGDLSEYEEDPIELPQPAPPTADTVEPPQSVPPAPSPDSDSPADEPPVTLTDNGQLVGASCPSTWQQCAGKTYDGKQNCCQEGLECAFQNEWYAQCLPKPAVTPSASGPDNTPDQEPTTQPEPLPVPLPEPQPAPLPDPLPVPLPDPLPVPMPEPAPMPESEPQAAPEPDIRSNCPTVWKQCGGERYDGIQNCCSQGSVCSFQNKWYSQCIPDVSAPPSTPPTQDPSEDTDSPEDPVKPSLPPPSPSPPPPSQSVDPKPSVSVPTASPPPAQKPTDAPLGSVDTANDPPPRTSVPSTARRVHRKTGLMQWLPSKSPDVPGASEWKYEIDTLLGMSFFFYEQQRAGPLPASTRAPWRGDSLKADGGGNLDGEAFQGGYFDAGDHNKFQLPTAYTVARLNWLLYAFPIALKKTYFDGQDNYQWAREAAKWGADFMALSTEEDRVLLHIGDIRADHSYIGRAEMYPQMDRNIRFCSPGTCSDVAAEIAASLAHAAVAFSDNPALSQEYWNKAKMAYAQSGAESGKFGASHEEYSVLATYYTSTGIRSHVFFAAASMYTACKALKCPDEAVYFAHTQKLGIMKEADGGQKWFWEVPSWDNAWWDGALLMAQAGIEGPEMFGKPAYTQFLRNFADKWTNGKSPIRVSPMGQRFTIEWGSNRFAMGGAAVLLMWANLPANMRGSKAVSVQDARCAAVKQLHYMAGDNDRGSYVVGFGYNPPQRNHHRNSVCAPWEQLVDKNNHCTKYFYDVISPAGVCPMEADSLGRCYPDADRPNKFQTTGALIGGPKTPTDAGDPNRVAYSLQGWNDWRMDWVGSEQTLDYNAMYTVALAAIIELPASFWTSPCGGVSNDLKMDKKAGLDRTPPTHKDNEVYIFEDFEEHGFTRTLPENWINEVP